MVMLAMTTIMRYRGSQKIDWVKFSTTGVLHAWETHDKIGSHD